MENDKKETLQPDPDRYRRKSLSEIFSDDEALIEEFWKIVLDRPNDTPRVFNFDDFFEDETDEKSND